ncbi:hypothetical protein [Chitinolyticbacter albus]|uniref:hypothetical protein n=1 Tax=Chitinolyticbacter albus TaxID=2961951 RepID=UPI00210E914E|nr:hypothetical protein [Chitinolyticbacter albus]
MLVKELVAGGRPAGFTDGSANALGMQVQDLPIEQCAGYVMVTPVEFQQLNVIAQVFAAPSPEQIQGAFMAGLSLPVIAYLTAWAYQFVINFIGKSR